EAQARAEQTRLAERLQVQSDAFERQSYTLGIALAQREWQGANLGRVRTILEASPGRLRGWEWDYLNRLCNLDRRTLPAADLFGFSPDGTRLAGLDERRGLRVWNLADGRYEDAAGRLASGHLRRSP